MKRTQRYLAEARGSNSVVFNGVNADFCWIIATGSKIHESGDLVPMIYSERFLVHSVLEVCLFKFKTWSFGGVSKWINWAIFNHSLINIWDPNNSALYMDVLENRVGESKRILKIIWIWIWNPFEQLWVELFQNLMGWSTLFLVKWNILYVNMMWYFVFSFFQNGCYLIRWLII